MKQYTVELILYFYKVLGSQVFTMVTLAFVIKTILFPFALFMNRFRKSMEKVNPELEKIKNSGASQEVINSKTFELYKKYNVNPLKIFIPIAVNLVVMVTFWRALNSISEDLFIQEFLLSWNMNLPDTTLFFPVLNALTFLLNSSMNTNQDNNSSMKYIFPFIMIMISRSWKVSSHIFIISFSIIGTVQDYIINRYLVD